MPAEDLAGYLAAAGTDDSVDYNAGDDAKAIQDDEARRATYEAPGAAATTAAAAAAQEHGDHEEDAYDEYADTPPPQITEELKARLQDREPRNAKDEKKSAAAGEDDEDADDGDDAGDGAGAAAAGASKAPEWVDGTIRHLMDLYDMTDADVAAMSGREEFSRTVDHLAAEWQKAEAHYGRQNHQQPSDQQQAAAQQRTAADEDDGTEFKRKDGRISEKFFENQGYDDAGLQLVKEFNVLLEREQTREAHDRQNQELTAIDNFHVALDAKGLGFLFGDTSKGKVGDVEAERRMSLYNQIDLQRQHAHSMARATGGRVKMPSEDVLLERAIAALHATEIEKHKREERNRKARRAAKNVRPALSGMGNAAASHGANHGKDPHSTEAIVSNPRVSAAWRKAQEEQGLDD